MPESAKLGPRCHVHRLQETDRRTKHEIRYHAKIDTLALPTRTRVQHRSITLMFNIETQLPPKGKRQKSRTTFLMLQPHYSATKSSKKDYISRFNIRSERSERTLSTLIASKGSTGIPVYLSLITQEQANGEGTRCDRCDSW